MQFTHPAGRKPIANYEADVMPRVDFSGGGGKFVSVRGDRLDRSVMVSHALDVDRSDGVHLER